MPPSVIPLVLCVHIYNSFFSRQLLGSTMEVI